MLAARSRPGVLPENDEALEGERQAQLHRVDTRLGVAGDRHTAADRKQGRICINQPQRAQHCFWQRRKRPDRSFSQLQPPTITPRDPPTRMAAGAQPFYSVSALRPLGPPSSRGSWEVSDTRSLPPWTRTTPRHGPPSAPSGCGLVHRHSAPVQVSVPNWRGLLPERKEGDVERGMGDLPYTEAELIRQCQREYETAAEHGGQDALDACFRWVLAFRGRRLSYQYRFRAPTSPLA